MPGLRRLGSGKLVRQSWGTSVKMGKGEQTGSGGRSALPVRVATAVGGGAGAAVALLWRPDLGGFWPGLIAFMALLATGLLLGRFAGALLFSRKPGSESAT